MGKAVKTSKKAAYETFPGMTAEEAIDKGYVEVENNGDGSAPVYGRYVDTSTGAALETLADKDDRVPTPASGVAPATPMTSDKGALVNPDDPVVHGTDDNNPHEDGGEPNPNDNSGLDVAGYKPGDDLKPAKGK